MCDMVLLHELAGAHLVLLQRVQPTATGLNITIFIEYFTFSVTRAEQTPRSRFRPPAGRSQD